MLVGREGVLEMNLGDSHDQSFGHRFHRLDLYGCRRRCQRLALSRVLLSQSRSTTNLEIRIKLETFGVVA